MHQLNDLASFTAVAETKGFTPAVRRLGISTAGVSKGVLRLEERLNSLFTRTTRRVALTPDGIRYYARCKAILEALAEAESEITDAASALRGRIRIDMPITYGERHVLPVLAEFKIEHPHVDLDIRLADTYSNLVDEGIDIAIRFGGRDDNRFVARKLGLCRLVTCAAPNYFTKYGTPKTLDDVAQHSCIGYRMRSSGHLFRWRFKNGSETVELDATQSVAVDDGAGYRRLALLGAGLVQDLHVNVAEELAAGTLVECLKKHSSPAFPLAVIWPAGRHQPHRVRVLVDRLIAALSWRTPKM
jgi:DNA-binding transcriptional LysR family regulator